MKRHALWVLGLATPLLLLGGCSDPAGVDATHPLRLEISPQGRSIALKEQFTFQVSAWTYRGEPVVVPHLTWTSSDASVASVDSSGTVTGLSLGAAVIEATGGGVNAYRGVAIRPAAIRIVMSPATLAVGDTSIITATRVDYNGDPIPGEFSPWWEYEETDVLEFKRFPTLPPGQLAVIGRAPGLVYLWVDGTGISGMLWITVVAKSASTG